MYQNMNWEAYHLKTLVSCPNKPETYRKYGLGIELIEKDMVYRLFLKSLKGQTKTPLRTPKEIGYKQVV